MKKTITCIFAFCICVHLFSQNVGIGTNAPSSSAQLDVASTNKGLLIPRLSSAQRKAITSPATGLLVYDTDKNALFLFDGVQWSFMNLGGESSIPPVPRTATDNQFYASAGVSVCMNGNYAIIGTSNGANSKGSAFLFFRSGGVWSQQARLEAADGFAGDNFGYSVSISGDRAVIGADGNGIGNGAAYVFLRNGTAWTQEAKLTASDGASGDRFGNSVSISGDYIVVGAPADDITFQDQGSAYMYYRSTGWVTGQPHQAKLIMSDPAAGDRLGTSIAINGDYVVVGAPGDDINFTDQGSALVFGRIGANWPFLAKLIALGVSRQNAFFGQTVAIDGNYIIIGAPFDLVSSYSGAGTAFIFYGGSGWSSNQSPQAILNDPLPQTQDNFGLGVSINGDFALVGLRNDEVKGETDAGSCRLYKRTGINWNLVRTIYDPEYTGAASFGYGVSISGSNIVIGSPNKFDGKGGFAFLNIE